MTEQTEARSTIRRRLLYRLIGAVVIVWCLVVLFAYRAVEHEVEEVFDAALAQEARVLATLLSHEAEEEADRRETISRLVTELGESAVKHSTLLSELVEKYGNGGRSDDYLTLLPAGEGAGHPYESKIAFRVSYRDGGVMLRSPNAPLFDVSTAGFSDFEDGQERWRLFNLAVPGGGLLVQVGERFSVRRETVQYLLFNSLWHMFLSLPILGVIIWVSVGAGLKPLERVAEMVEQRRPGSLQPLAVDGVPGEVAPMVEALNQLLRRVHNAIESERRFTANAAHELRTPLAALKSQAQAKQLSDANGENGVFLAQIVEGVDRTTRLLEQLLALARADVLETEALLGRSVDLRALAAGVLSTLGERALRKRVDLSLAGASSPLLVRGDETSLGILVTNLVDNAIRYTPAGGSVEVRIQREGSWTRLQVEDTGPGIPAEKRDLLFERFQRGEGVEERGSGLGLSIVKQIAELHGADITLAGGNGGRGLVVTVSFPGPDANR